MPDPNTNEDRTGPDLQVFQDLLERRVDGGLAPGYAVGLVDRDGPTLTCCTGVLDRGGSDPIDEDTIFEIGSITKVFTTLLLARMASSGEVRLEDPVRIHTPDEISIAEHPGGVITLEHLATHTSGLDRMPANIGGLSERIDYADFGIPDLFRYLVGRRPPERPGDRCIYSNLGVALLGHALAHRHRGSFDDALSRWILDPLAMTSTSSEPLPERADRTATGHDVLAPVPGWNIPGLAPAGNLRSSLRDMLVFTESILHPARTDLDRDLAAGLRRRRHLDESDTHIGLGWKIDRHRDRDIVWHNGGTGGFASYLGADVDRGFGVVVLCNSNDRAVDDLGRHLLGIPHREIEPRQIASDVLDDYAGRFQSPDHGLRLEVETSENRLRIVVPGHGHPMAADSIGNDAFTIRVAHARIDFLRDHRHVVDRADLQLGGDVVRFDRVAGSPAS